ncbi:MAG: hypothetical protein ACXWNS_04350 [Isosphaeraceae bacterium]
MAVCVDAVGGATLARQIRLATAAASLGGGEEEPCVLDHFLSIRARYHGVVLRPPQLAGLWLASKIVRKVSS